jgi:two-component system chemotaxis sensor kinase CheA
MTGRARREDFASEAAERLETIHEILDPAGTPSIGRINELFRAVHSLKGLAGLSGLDRFGAALHEAENLLDAVRLSRVAWAEGVRSALLRFFDDFEEAVSRPGSSDAGFAPEEAVEILSRALGGAEHAPPRARLDLDLPARTLACLSEYEESRLRANLASGRQIWALEVSFDLSAFESGLKDLGARLNAQGEWIATLPQADGFTADRIAVQLLAAAPGEPAQMGVDVRARRVSREVEPPAAGTASPASGEATVRIESARLGELLSEIEEARAAFQKLAREIESLAQGLSPGERVRTSRMRERVAASLSRLARMAAAARAVPLSQLAARLSRAADRLIQRSGKSAGFRVLGGESEIDRALADDLADPLLHLLRNAIDHGIETPAERRAAGKPEKGSITLMARSRRSRLVISLADDGRGIDEDAVRRRAAALGWIEPEARPDRDTTYSFLFRPGFSTARAVSQLSGRGVGLDLVSDRVAARHGEVRVRSERGRGCRFEIDIAVAQAVFDALVVEDRGRPFAFPLAALSRVEPEAAGGPDARSLSVLLGEAEEPGAGRRVRVVMPDDSALSVDRVLRQELLVVRPVESEADLPFLIGASEGAEREAILVIDPKRLTRFPVRPGSAA